MLSIATYACSTQGLALVGPSEALLRLLLAGFTTTFFTAVVHMATDGRNPIGHQNWRQRQQQQQAFLTFVHQCRCFASFFLAFLPIVFYWV